MREQIQQNGAAWLAIGGFLIGLAFGVIGIRTHFCAMGAISDLVSLGDTRRLRAWLLAGAVALLGAQGLAASGMVAIETSMYLAPRLNWLGHLAGGAMFGFGMVLGGGCASRNLVRAGSGDLRALIVLIVMGLSAYAAAGGIVGPARAWIERSSSVDLAPYGFATQSLGEVLGIATGTGAARGNLLAAILVAGAITAYCFADSGFRASPVHIASGLGVGLCVIAGWALTGLAFDEFSDKPVAPISLTFVRPTGDTLEWLQRFTAEPVPGFGVMTVLGTLAGAFLVAAFTRRLRVITFVDGGDTLQCLAGAMLMGTGGVLALGCTIGQAITGVSTLAAGSFLTFAGIVAGGVASIKWLEARLDDAA